MGTTAKECAIDFVERLRPIIEAMVVHPGDVSLHYRTAERTVLIEVQANGGDYGNVIGWKGKTIDALRVISGAAGRMYGCRIVIETVGDRNGRKG